MKLVLLRVGRGRTHWADEGVADYVKRLGQKLQFVEQLVAPEPFRGDVEAVRAAEAERILGHIRPGDRLVALDERGKHLDSHGFAELINTSAQQSTRRLVFAMGGPYGHGAPVRDQAWRVLALSEMVLNHEVARVLLAEQVYRASTLIWGGSYHH